MCIRTLVIRMASSHRVLTRGIWPSRWAINSSARTVVFTSISTMSIATKYKLVSCAQHAYSDNILTNRSKVCNHRSPKGICETCDPASARRPHAVSGASLTPYLHSRAQSRQHPYLVCECGHQQVFREEGRARSLVSGESGLSRDEH